MVKSFFNKHLLVLFLLSFSPILLLSQPVDHQLWSELRLGGKWNERNQWQALVSHRFIIGSVEWNQYIGRFKWDHHLPKGQVVLAELALFHTTLKGFPSVTEVRPWQGYQVTWPKWSSVEVGHLFRLEERFFFQEGMSSSFDLRGRYQQKWNFILWNDPKKGWKFRLPVSGEVFLNLDGEIFPVLKNRYRFGTGLDVQYNESWQWGLITYYQNSRSPIADSDAVGEQLIQAYVKYFL